MQIDFELITEDLPGRKWQSLFTRLWPHHRAWYLSESLRDRPTFLPTEASVIVGNTADRVSDAG